MTREDVQKRVAEIRSIAHDAEAAHAKEDDLYREVLHAIAMGHPDPLWLAREAIVTQVLKFPRWCA